MSRATCPICGGHVATLGSRGEFEVARCLACHHAFVCNLPAPEELAALYERYSYDAAHLEALPAFLVPVVAEKIRTFRPFRRTNRLLEVGFGAGAMLRAARDDGWQTVGIEQSTLAVEQALRHGLGDVIQEDFRSAQLEERGFDVVVMSELIEHIPEPLEFLRVANRVLRPGGVLYLTTPHGHGVSGRILGAGWSVCAPPEHLHLFSWRSMGKALDEAGFVSSRVQTRTLHPHELITWARSRLSRPRPRKPAPDAVDVTARVESSYRLNAMLVGSRAGKVAKSIANRVLDLTRLGDGIVVYATTSSGG